MVGNHQMYDILYNFFLAQRGYIRFPVCSMELRYNWFKKVGTCVCAYRELAIQSRNTDIE